MRISWGRLALDDLRAIDDWLSREAAPDIAVKTLVAIRARARFLQDFPRGGRPVSGGDRVLRIFGTPYLIRYRIAGNEVAVIRVHHERENWQIEP